MVQLKKSMSNVSGREADRQHSLLIHRQRSLYDQQCSMIFSCVPGELLKLYDNFSLSMPFFKI
ncbi:Uncharacterised protein [Yersinia bercovieri]|nr:Uncharacterised protein [Yersinia bercovieri]